MFTEYSKMSVWGEFLKQEFGKELYARFLLLRTSNIIILFFGMAYTVVF
jgi:hypothetical protein